MDYRNFVIFHFIFFNLDFVDYDMDFKWYNDNFEKVAPLSLRYLDSTSNPEMVTKAIKQFYFNNREITKADWVNLTNVMK